MKFAHINTLTALFALATIIQGLAIEQRDIEPEVEALSARAEAKSISIPTRFLIFA